MPFVPKASLAGECTGAWCERRSSSSRRRTRSPCRYSEAAQFARTVSGVENESCPTVVIDLGQPEDMLWSGVESKTRKVIRQASATASGSSRCPVCRRKSGVNFHAAYQKLRSRKKGADPLGIGQIGELIERDSYVMTTSRDASGNIVVVA